MYNVKVKRTLVGEEIHYYTIPINDDNDADRRKVVPTTGEICPSNRIVYWNPFDEDYVIGCMLHNDESSIKRSMRRTKQVVHDLAKSNDWEYFFTLTFDPMKVDSFNYEEVTRKLSQWLKNIRKKCPKLKYIVVPEHHKSGRWHFHGLFVNCDDLKFVDSGKKTDKGQPIYNVDNYRYGFSTAIRLSSIDAITTYITKYITKELCELTRSKKRYWASRNCDRPIEYKYLIEGFEKDVDDMFNAEVHERKSENGYQKVRYYSTSIYTTNTMRFNTNADEEIFPPHIGICESNEDNIRHPD